MSERFAQMKKLPKEPAARVLALKATKLGTKIKAPANAPIEAVLNELAEQEAWVDVIRLLSAALPDREAVWWSCLAARDILEDEKAVTPCLKAAEAWVFAPTPENRKKVQQALDAVDTDDDTALAATAALYAPGDMGPGDMAEHQAPPAAVSACSFGMNMMTLDDAEDPVAAMQILIDRAVDIARGGNGKLKPADAEKVEGDH